MSIANLPNKAYNILSNTFFGDKMIIHTVKSGETVASIADTYGVPASRIISDNFLTDADKLAVGQTLVILFPKITYTVKKGDTLSGIAELFGQNIITLWQNNPLLDGQTNIVPGQVLNILYPEKKVGRVISSGFAYTDTDESVLRRTLPYLTRISIFTYGITSKGELLEADDSKILELAREYKAQPVMVISSRTEDGKFNSENIKKILDNNKLTSEYINSVTKTAKEKSYSGVEADFEYLGEGYASKYSDFINNLRSNLDENGIFLTVDLAPKASDSMQGSLYEGLDYSELGEDSDYSFLMTYEWGYKYSEPMAISPENKVMDVVEYAVRAIDPDKILLGIPNYGYVWKLPYEEGKSAAVSVSNTEAVQLATDFGTEIKFNTLAASPYFQFTTSQTGDSDEYEVWFEDARTIKGALDIVHDYGLVGFGVWNIRRYFPQLGAVLNSTFEIIKE